MSPSECEAPLIGFIVGVTTEAARLKECPVPRVVRCSGADAGRAERVARELVSLGVRGLVGFGLAGGLTGATRPGAVVVPAEVILEDGRRLSVDPEWGRRAGAAGSLLAVDHVVTSPTEKRKLAKTGAVAVDMESGAVARVALEHGLPFLVIRAIADPVERAPPAVLNGTIGSDGRTRIGRLALNLLRAPGQIGGLVRLALDSRAGLTTLETLARGLAPPPEPFITERNNER